jgi:hypothetical protein
VAEAKVQKEFFQAAPNTVRYATVVITRCGPKNNFLYFRLVKFRHLNTGKRFHKPSLITVNAHKLHWHGMWTPLNEKTRDFPEFADSVWSKACTVEFLFVVLSATKFLFAVKVILGTVSSALFPGNNRERHTRTDPIKLGWKNGKIINDKTKRNFVEVVFWLIGSYEPIIKNYKNKI